MTDSLDFCCFPGNSPGMARPRLNGRQLESFYETVTAGSVRAAAER